MERDRKTAQIICFSLMNYFFEQKINHLKVDMDFTAEGFSVEISGQCLEKPDGLEKMASSLNKARQPEMDAYYDQLLTAEAASQRYYLLGAMVDEAQVNFQDGTLSIRVRQKHI